ncbi:MAG: hypothetical protein LBB08_01635 [Rickettsiales bacterium]|jgi:outer membrane protein OmpA-like peptidoglycan-associated protein|nr:hypothetical protein [Rickettsiales bacterium]
MSKFHLSLTAVLLASPAFAVGELPVIDPARSVSALELYGEVPPQRRTQSARNSADALRVAAKSGGNEYLVPKRPEQDLWSNVDAPLRMPEKSEYSVFGAGPTKFLPEESLDSLARNSRGPMGAEISRFAARTRKVRSAPIVRDAPVRAKKAEFVPSGAVEDEGLRPDREVKAFPSVIKSAPKYVPAKRAAVPDPIEREPVGDSDEFAYKNPDEIPLTRLSPAQLKRAFKKTFLKENKHLSTYEIDDGYDVASFDESEVGFDSSRDLSEQSGGVRPLEIKISFDDDDSALSRDTYNLLSEYAGIVAANPKRAVQVSISERGTRTYDGRKLAARRLAIIEQVLKDSGVLERRIVPVLSQRSDDSFVLRVISNDTFQTLVEQKRDMFGDTASTKTVRSMSW